ncbi:hypothetical protein AVEN_59298-1 [Araneus ventricosus]|uniref:Uncharacterized protein n=1 Tax=Araneus ventricosus TaxID=182803 RepID=A0A4Y2G962_ARAVE|nr:hypothetical protein AVEN_59298-1 [Araneus ventricosus]
MLERSLPVGRENSFNVDVTVATETFSDGEDERNAQFTLSFRVTTFCSKPKGFCAKRVPVDVWNEKSFKDLEHSARKILRSSDSYHNEEGQRNAEAKKILRSQELYRIDERQRDANAKKILRSQDSYRESEQLRDRESKQNRRNVDLFKARENYCNLLRENDNNGKKLKLQFLKDRCFMPYKIRCYCEELFFNHSVLKLNLKRFCEKHSEEFSDRIFNYDSKFICATCSRHVNNGKVPKLATRNGIKFVYMPERLNFFSILEERIVSSYINFMQLKPVKACVLMKFSVSTISENLDVRMVIDLLVSISFEALLNETPSKMALNGINALASERAGSGVPMLTGSTVQQRIPRQPLLGDFTPERGVRQ